jgi:hypothetical protein
MTANLQGNLIGNLLRLPYSPIPTPTPTPTPVGGEEGREESSSNSFEFDSPPPEQSREGGEVGLALKGLPSSPSVSVMQKNPAQDDTFVERHVATLVDTLVAKHGDGIGTEVQRLLDAGVDMKKLHYALSFISLPDSGKLNRPPLVRLHAELKERGVDVQALGGGMPREVEDADVPF